MNAVWLAISNTATIPPGYCPRPENGVAAFYDWFDYKETLNYLCRRTGPDTRVANALLNQLFMFEFGMGVAGSEKVLAARR